ncbi:hypothetical protein DFH28DRAFT_947712 [Melampsora americana]|nr:hypothetical protein DFH28DRAFT_947712 [Melampsora americana]
MLDSHCSAYIGSSLYVSYSTAFHLSIDDLNRLEKTINSLCLIAWVDTLLIAYSLWIKSRFFKIRSSYLLHTAVYQSQLIKYRL